MAEVRWKGSITATASGSSSVVADFEAGEAVHRDDLHAIAPSLWAVGQPLLERLFRAILQHVQ